MKFALLALSSLMMIAQSSFARQNMITAAFPGKVTLTVDLGITAKYSGKTDVLFVVDNSGSMSTHQANLIKNIPTLVDGLVQSNIDFNAAVVTTDMDGFAKPCCGEFAGTTKIVNRMTSNATGVLAQNLNVGVNGSGTEQIFGAIKTALSPQMLTGVNAGFLRNDAFLAIVFVTDAEDQTKTGTAADLIGFLKALKPDSNMIGIQGIMVPSTDKNCTRDDAAVNPVRLEELLTAFNGAQFNLCSPNYPGQMKTVTDNIIKRAQKGPGVPPHPSISRIPLPNVPDFKTITVTWGNTILAAGDLSYGWVYDRAKNEIVLGDQIDWSLEIYSTPLIVNYIPQDWK